MADGVAQAGSSEMVSVRRSAPLRAACLQASIAAAAAAAASHSLHRRRDTEREGGGREGWRERERACVRVGRDGGGRGVW